MFLKNSEIRYFRKVLLGMKEELSSIITDELEFEKSADSYDAALNEKSSNTRVIEKTKAMEMLKQVNMALSRIETNKFGICMRTGDPIDIRRLKVNPVAVCNINIET
ncbi:TraR/DksA family transcriptional regulator [Candidatus Nesciobacter abundans]|uniref:TraR/DksA family transcriptional regulator n=1 Tax=Candidatus Nesciobacter abundans TaxID=2601668 RepID=A0A5C0UI78_9PROT|nr:TraR/DksA family transcriptional regulator [Candidatus Nesciobacter abundans]QEK39092.1 TraR/DksA family transcriptional regulator [Candidatus Nesciobacter abundans]